MRVFFPTPTNYYEIQNNRWVKTKLSAEKLSWHMIRLYDDDLNHIGMGLYPATTNLKPIEL